LVSATIDHMISITIFLAAILLFMNLFSQTIQTAIIYQGHRTVATKCSDLIDNMLLNSGNPGNWGQTNSTPTGFGLQDPEFTQYQLSPFSLMRLTSSSSGTVYCKDPTATYSLLTMGFGNSLLMPTTSALNYSLALKLLGVNNTYGFQLTLTPVVTVAVTENNASNPLSLSLRVTGTGFPLANASINYFLILVSLPASEGEYPSYSMLNGTVRANVQGSATVEFPEVTDPNLSYAFVAYAHLGGLVGVGYNARVSSTDQYVVPLIGALQDQTILIAHNYDLNSSGPAGFSLKYNATFVLSAEDFTLREMPLASPTTVGTVTSGVGNPYANITIPTYTPGILIVTYQKNATAGGVVVMPWGISALAFPVKFGGDPQEQEWVATDIRQVMVNRVAYQATLALWSYKGQQVIG
jgi:hypothetical protein